MSLRALAFDWGHTIMDEVRDGDVPLDSRPIHLMPGVLEVIPRLSLPLALWANTKSASSVDVYRWLERAGIGHHFRWVTTSVEARARNHRRRSSSTRSGEQPSSRARSSS